MVSVNAVQDCLVPRAIAQEVRRVVVEALGNAGRHAHAKTIEVGLRRDGRQVLVSVADDGRGMDLGGQDSPSAPHFGLNIMRLRAAAIGGYLEIRSEPGCGTEVTLRWPGTTRARRPPGC